MKQVTRYEAFDGSIFETEADCRDHESHLAHARLVGLTLDQINSAMRREDAGLADAIETVGAAIARARRASGEMRRQRTQKVDPSLRPANWRTDEAVLHDP